MALRSTRLWGRTRRMFLPLSLIVLVAAAFVVPLPAYAERPGESLDLTECVVIDPSVAQEVNGDLLLTFATFRRATVVDLLWSVVADDIVLSPVQRVIPSDLPPQDFWQRERTVFDTTAERAAAVALELAGFEEPVVRRGRGARVVGVVAGFPAEGTLEAGDVVIGVDGQPVRTADDLRAAVLPGEPVRLRVHRGPDVRTVTLTPELRELDGEQRPLIGVELETIDERVELPVDVEVRAGSIGGPSAGLMIALDVYDAVAPGDLLGGRRVAGTGEIAADGRVGPIGALSLKVRAAAEQHASVFLAPAAQVEEARAAVPDGSGLEVVGVADLAEAVDVLATLPPAEGPLPEAEFRACTERVAGLPTGSTVPGAVDGG